MKLLQAYITRDIPGYEGLYKATTNGDIISVKKNKVMCAYVDNRSGYVQLCLRKNKKDKRYYVHTLIMLTFVGPKPIGMDINHKDENKQNNSLSNLEYCTRSYNINYGNRNQKVSLALMYHPNKIKPVLQFTKDGKLIKRWPSASQIERELGYFQAAISSCCVGKTKTSYGYIWHYEEEQA